MSEMVKQLLSYHGAHSKLIVWAHNSHVGDAHYSDMQGRGRSNLGEMLRKDMVNENVFIVGMGSYKGSILAARNWDSAAQVMEYAPARKGSIEELLHSTGEGNRILLSKDLPQDTLFSKWMWHRGMGLVENPRSGLLGSYVNSLIPKRYDAFIFLEETHPLHPLEFSNH